MHTWSLMHSMHILEIEIEILDYNIVIVIDSAVMIHIVQDFRLINTFQTIKLLEVLLIMLIHKCI